MPYVLGNRQLFAPSSSTAVGLQPKVSSLSLFPKARATGLMNYKPELVLKTRVN
jgi:hypothetical protein